MLPLKDYPFSQRPMICAHRGDTSHGARENTLDAVSAALASGADMVEIDVQMTADNVLICYHDETVEDQGVKMYFWKETGHDLRVKLGERMPALFDDVLKLAKGKAYLNIEMKEYSGRKPETFTGPLVDVVRKNGMHDFSLYSSFRLDYVRAMPWDALTTIIRPTSEVLNFFNARSSQPVVLSKKVEEMLPSELMHEARATTYACMLDELSPDHVHDIKSRNIHLSVYTIKHEAEFQRAIQLGAKAVVTDTPLEMVELRNRLYPVR